MTPEISTLPNKFVLFKVEDTLYKGVCRAAHILPEKRLKLGMAQLWKLKKEFTHPLPQNFDNPEVVKLVWVSPLWEKLGEEDTEIELRIGESIVIPPPSDILLNFIIGEQEKGIRVTVESCLIGGKIIYDSNEVEINGFDKNKLYCTYAGTLAPFMVEKRFICGFKLTKIAQK